MSKRMRGEGNSAAEIDILCDLRVSSKRTKKERNSSEVDRLSKLPDDILQYNLGFLQTKDVVKTCVLSKRWKNLWTSIPVLDFDINSFTKLPAFKKFVRNVLRVREGKRNSPVGTIRFSYRGRGDDKRFMERFINNVKSHYVHHLNISMDSFWYKNGDFASELFEYQQNLETLQLKSFKFSTEPFRLTKLTSLQLEDCKFSADGGGSGSFDVLSCCPNLLNLCLIRCKCDSDFKVLKISSPKLISLTIDDLLEYMIIGVPEVEISAPKVTFFRCKLRAETLDFKKINLPSLQHADLDFSPPLSNCVQSEKTRAYVNLLKLFEGIANVQSLAVSYSTIETLDEVPGLEQLPTPFSRLKPRNLKQEEHDNGPLRYLQKSPPIGVATSPVLLLN